MRSTTGAYENVDPPWQDAYTEYGITVNSGQFDGLAYQSGARGNHDLGQA